MHFLKYICYYCNNKCNNYFISVLKKLQITFDKDQELHTYLEDLIERNLNVDDNRSGDALLWLKRSLELICMFFDNICQDKQCLQTLKLHLKDAYEQTLKPFHGFLIQNTIKVIYCVTIRKHSLLLSLLTYFVFSF